MFKNPLATPEHRANIREMGANIKASKMKLKDKQRALAGKVSHKMVNRDEEGRRTPDADRNRGD